MSEQQVNLERAMVGLPDPDMVRSIEIDSIIIAYKEGIIKASDIAPNVVQRLHEQFPHSGMVEPSLDIHEVVVRRNCLQELAAACIVSQLSEDIGIEAPTAAAARSFWPQVHQQRSDLC